MSKIVRCLFGLCILGLALLVVRAAFAQQATPAGFWVTVDDKTQKPTALVEISERDGELSGFVRQIFPQPGDDPEPRCEKCEGVLKDQPIKGMRIVWGLKKSGDAYTEGHILDPDEGVTYRCRIKLTADGRQLEVRGYIGVPLLGRTQVWTRQAAPAAAKPPG
jgi:uncharacterized protein (DUF2147 family)